VFPIRLHSGLAPVAWMMRRLWRKFQPSLGSFQESAKLLFSYGIRSYGIDLCGTMSLYVDQALVVRLLAPDQMGTYVVALSLSRMLNLFHTSVVMVLFPKAVSRLPREVAAMTSRAMRMSTLLSAFAGIGIAASTFLRTWQDFEMVQIVLLPMFLFSATFFPLSVYPPAIQWFVRFSPLYHAITLIRSLTLGSVGPINLLNATYLLVLGAVGIAIARRRMAGLLLT